MSGDPTRPTTNCATEAHPVALQHVRGLTPDACLQDVKGEHATGEVKWVESTGTADKYCTTV
jgi:hypothetical protein